MMQCLLNAQPRLFSPMFVPIATTSASFTDGSESGQVTCSHQHCNSSVQVLLLCQTILERELHTAANSWGVGTLLSEGSFSDSPHYHL